MPRIMLDMDSSELEKYITDAIGHIAETHDGFTRWTLGDFRHAMVVSWKYRGNMDDAYSRDLDDILSGFTEQIAEAIAEELIESEHNRAE